MERHRGAARGLPAIHKRLRVPLAPDAACRLFTEGISEWWPLASHSIGEGRAERCVFEPRAGGRIYEVTDDRREALWGTVSAWEPPRRVVFQWHPGRDPATAQEVEVRFEPADGGAEVHLEHRGWDALGGEARELHRRYVTGWDFVLVECYGRSAGAGR